MWSSFDRIKCFPRTIFLYFLFSIKNLPNSGARRSQKCHFIVTLKPNSTSEILMVLNLPAVYKETLPLLLNTVKKTGSVSSAACQTTWL